MIDVNLIRKVQKELEEKLKEIEKKYDVSLSFSGSTYDEETATMKLILQAGEESLMKSRKDYYLQVCSLFDLKLEYFGKVAKDKAQELKFIGIDKSKRKNCMILKDINTGDEYRANTNYIKVLFENI